MSGDQNGTDRIGTTGLRSVAQVLRDDRPTAAEAVGLAAATAAEVAALHAAGRVHGHLDPEAVLIDDRGDAVLGGPAPRRIGPAAPPELVFADLRAVGRILALGLGWAVPDRRLPVPVEDLLTRAEAAGTPSTALALALRRLQRDPSLTATLLPPVPTAAPARPVHDGRPLAGIVPSSARRTTSVAAGLVAGIAVVGGALLLAGAPAGAGLAPRNAVAAPQAAASSAAPFQDTAAIQPAPSSIERLLRGARTAAPVPAAPQRVQAAAPVPRPQVQASRPAAPVRSASPSPSPSGGTTVPTASPAPTAPPSPAPSAPAGAPTAAPAPTAPAPAPTHVVPSAPSSPSAPTPTRTGSPSAG